MNIGLGLFGLIKLSLILPFPPIVILSFCNSGGRIFIRYPSCITNFAFKDGGGARKMAKRNMPMGNLKLYVLFIKLFDLLPDFVYTTGNLAGEGKYLSRKVLQPFERLFVFHR